MLKRIYIVTITPLIVILFIFISISAYGMTKVTTKGENLKEINPMDKAVFPIEIVNDNIYLTEVNFKIESIPNGWSAIIQDSIIIKSNTTEIVYFTVTPPNGFGFHNDMANFKVFVGSKNLPFSNLTFFVESIGFSSNGFEIILPLVILIIGIPASFYLLKKKKIK